MPLGEFELISRFFSRPSARDDVLLGVGGDAAVLRVPEGMALVAATDTLVEGRHFLPGTEPESIGHQALAVNLSDMAAMGAVPAWVLLSLSIPQSDEEWVRRFASGLYPWLVTISQTGTRRVASTSSSRTAYGAPDAPEMAITIGS